MVMVMSTQSESKRKNFKCQNDISCILGHLALQVKLTCTDCIAIIIIVLFLCYAICSTLEIMHKFINNYDIIGQNVGQIRQTSGTKSETTGTIVPVYINMLKYALFYDAHLSKSLTCTSFWWQ